MKVINILQSEFKRNFVFIFINLLSLFFALYLFHLDHKTEILAAILAVGISLSIGLKQVKVENDKMFKELFIKFNATYDEKFNNTLNDIENKFKINNLYKLDNSEEALIIDYLNFCAEEYLWYTKNRIDENVWQSWRNGMLHFFNIAPINSFIITEKDQENSYYGLFGDIKKNLHSWN